MNTQQIISLFRNAGFEASVCPDGRNVMITLKNRRVSTIEVQYLIDDQHNKLVTIDRGIILQAMTNI